MKTPEKFSETKIGRVLPFAMTFMIAAQFVACGNKNGARETITPGRLLNQVNSKANGVFDPKLRERMTAASARKVQKNADGTFSVLVSLLVSNPQNPSQKWVVHAGSNKVPVSVAPLTPQGPNTEDALEGSTAPAPGATLNPSVAPAASVPMVVLERQSGSAEQELSQVQAKLYAICKDAECKTLKVAYTEMSQAPASPAAAAASFRAGAVNKAIAVNRNAVHTAAAHGTTRSKVSLRFSDVADGSGVMRVESACADQHSACGLPSFEEAVSAALASSWTLIPQQQAAPSPQNTQATPEQQQQNQPQQGAQPAAHSPSQSGGGTTPAADHGPTDTNVPHEGKNGADGAPGTSDNAHP